MSVEFLTTFMYQSVDLDDTADCMLQNAEHHAQQHIHLAERTLIEGMLAVKYIYYFLIRSLVKTNRNH